MTPLLPEPLSSQGGSVDLVAIAEAAWRVREMMHLNLLRVVHTGDEVLIKNYFDAVNDLNQHLPMCEDGCVWRRSVAR